MTIKEQMMSLESGMYYWVQFKGYATDNPIPCYFMKDIDPDDSCFLPGGMGDSSSMGVYADEISKIGPKIEVPIF